MSESQSDRQASREQEAAWFFSRLFDGIELDPATASRARQIILDTVNDLRRDRPPPIKPWDHWDEVMAAHAACDRELAALLSSDMQTRFQINAAAVRAHFDDLRARADAS